MRLASTSTIRAVWRYRQLGCAADSRYAPARRSAPCGARSAKRNDRRATEPSRLWDDERTKHLGYRCAYGTLRVRICSEFGISVAALKATRRPVCRTCLDWSELGRISPAALAHVCSIASSIL